MNVTIINATRGPVDLLLFTKATRLNMTPSLMDDIKLWDDARRAKELAYMATTIRSSWEFINITFLIEGISRACAQQVTRTRHGRYAMQSQRVTDVSEMGVVPAEKYKDEYQEKVWKTTIEHTKSAYKVLIQDGMAPQDARGLLPINTECNLVAQYDLRTFVSLVKARSSLRAQGEYQELAKRMREEVLAMWAWAEPFFQDESEAAIMLLEEAAKGLGLNVGNGPAWQIAKAIDLIRAAEGS